MKCNPPVQHRRSIRLKGYDYSRVGLYFITLCCQNRICFFGEIENGKMNLNVAGRMVEKWYYELGNKYPDKRCHEMIVMPNHFHCIIENITIGETISNGTKSGAHVGAPLRGRPINNDLGYSKIQSDFENKKCNASIGNIIGWFKTMTTNEYIRGIKTLGWQTFDNKLWQRNYFEHIIRNQQSYIQISDYINTNDLNWDQDSLK